MHSKSDNKGIMIYNKVDEAINELFESLLNRYQRELCHKINLKRGGSYIDSSDWIKNKYPNINPINDDDNGFQYAATVALNHKEIGKSLQRISKIKPFINKYN